ncbi:sequence-specific DNA binding transcription factor [Raphanus sativus]|nr:sequence-specific DNA binding transcription factor [Raphanus sativus]
MKPNGFSAFDPRMLTLEMPQNPPNPPPSYPHTSKAIQLSPLSGGDDEDRGSGSGSGCHLEDSSGTDGKRRVSQWHRMKWTDTMVRLLIMAVFYIGDEGGAVNDQAEAKKKTGGGGGMLQKKGKWKSVSRAMVEKGFSVSPQQCEDKFNDLNKRYKRVNDILGKGTACRVVENQGLLDTMDHHLTPKLKEEVKKLISSKHLFFKEMCAYHNSCGSHLEQPSLAPSHHHCMSEETARVMDDQGKSAWEKKEWMRRKALELEERKVGCEWEAVEMEKKRVKWMSYRSKKESEMEKAKLENQRRMLETERMVLILRRREIELAELQLLGKRFDPSSATG